MERTEILSWFFGIGAMFSLFLVYQQKQRKKLLVCKLCADLCWVAHYLCLGACGGVIPNFIGIFRELIFISREKRRWANHIFWPIFFICLIFLGITSFDNTINILPITASMAVTVSLWFKKPKLTKTVLLPVSAMFLVYDVFVGSYIGVVNESLSILSLLISLFRIERKNVSD